MQYKTTLRYFTGFIMLLAVMTMGTLLTACAGNTAPSNSQEMGYSTESSSAGETGGLEEADSGSENRNHTEETESRQEDTEQMEEIISGSFAIQNVQTGKNIRPYHAGTSNGNDIILYPHNEWKCLTYEFTHVEGDIYQLKNLYTGKTFEPVSEPAEGTKLWQQPVGEGEYQYWEFIRQDDDTFMIRLKDTDLCVAISSDEDNSPIVLSGLEDSDGRMWRLIEQYPPY